MIKKYNLLSPDNYHYVNQSGVYEVDDIDDNNYKKTIEEHAFEQAIPPIALTQ